MRVGDRLTRPYFQRFSRESPRDRIPRSKRVRSVEDTRSELSSRRPRSRTPLGASRGAGHASFTTSRRASSGGAPRRQASRSSPPLRTLFALAHSRRIPGPGSSRSTGRVMARPGLGAATDALPALLLACVFVRARRWPSAPLRFALAIVRARHAGCVRRCAGGPLEVRRRSMGRPSVHRVRRRRGRLRRQHEHARRVRRQAVDADRSASRTRGTARTRGRAAVHSPHAHPAVLALPCRGDRDRDRPLRRRDRDHHDLQRSFRKRRRGRRRRGRRVHRRRDRRVDVVRTDRCGLLRGGDRVHTTRAVVTGRSAAPIDSTRRTTAWACAAARRASTARRAAPAGRGAARSRPRGDERPTRPATPRRAAGSGLSDMELAIRVRGGFRHFRARRRRERVRSAQVC